MARRGILVLVLLLALVWQAQAELLAGGVPVAVQNLPLVVQPGQPPATPTAAGGLICDAAYPNVCIPAPPPDLDCNRIIYRNFIVLPPDPHNFDADHDGIGCEDPATATRVPTFTIPTAAPAPTGSVNPTIIVATPTDTSSTGALVVYRVEGLASLVVVSYINAAGNAQDIEVSLPWSIQFNAAVDADLAVDAFSNIDEAVALSCTITVNGVTVASQQTQNAIDGVSCERFAQ